MATLTTQDYDPRLGVTIPPSFVPTGLVEPSRRSRLETEELYLQARERTSCGGGGLCPLERPSPARALGDECPELYHVARLRLDGHAQWDIRRLSERVIELARERMPGLLILACGKDAFAARKADLFGPEE